MRSEFILALAVLLAGFGAVRGFAQEKDRKLEERLLRPDMSMQSDFQSKSFTQSGRFRVRSSAAAKPFGYSQKARTGSFNAGGFHGSKEFSQRGKRASTKSANLTTKSKLRERDRTFASKGVTTKAAYDADRSYASGGSGYSTGEYRARGKSQDALDQQTAKARNLSVDEVRELLNKNE